MLKGIEIFKAIAELEPGRVNQNHGTYTREKPCCVGAHLAHQLDVSWEKDPDAYPRHLNDYFRGADEWGEENGCNPRPCHHYAKERRRRTKPPIR